MQGMCKIISQMEIINDLIKPAYHSVWLKDVSLDNGNWFLQAEGGT